MRARTMSPFGAALFSGMAAGLLMESDPLAPIRESDGPDETLPAPAPKPAGGALERAWYGPAIGVSTIMRDGKSLIARGIPVQPAWLIDRGEIVGVQLVAVEAE
jgi:hypothetical protein